MHAVCADAAIINTFLPEWLEEKYFERLSKYCSYKFNCPVNAFGISRQKLDYNAELELHSPMFLDEDIAKALCEHLVENTNVKRSIINLTDVEAARKEIEYFLDALEENRNAL